MQNLKQAFQEYLTKRGYSLARVGEAIGYKPSVLSQWQNGKYLGNIESVEEKVSSWLELQLSREAQNQDLPILSLPRTHQIQNVLRTALEEKFIAMILGPSGSGKSRALDDFRGQNKHISILLECDPSLQLSSIIIALARELGVEAKGRISEVSERIIAELRRRDVVVIFDEAHYLTDNTLEYLRIAINGKGRSGLVFVGLEALRGRIKNLRNDHRQLENRIGILYRLPEVDEEDVRKILVSTWEHADPEVLSAFWTACHKCLHTLTRHMANTRRAMRANNLNMPTLAAVSAAAKYLMD